LGEVLGKFEVGYEFDGLMVESRLDDEEEGFDYFKEDSAEIFFEKWVNMGDERNIKRVWVQGKEVTILRKQQWLSNARATEHRFSAHTQG